MKTLKEDFSQLNLEKKPTCCGQLVEKNFCPDCGKNTENAPKIFFLGYYYGPVPIKSQDINIYSGNFRFILANNKTEAYKKYKKIIIGRMPDDEEEERILPLYICSNTQANIEKITAYKNKNINEIKNRIDGLNKEINAIEKNFSFS